MELKTREKAYVTMCARQMHPDMEFGKPSAEEREVTKRYNLIDQLDDLKRVTLNFDLPADSDWAGPVSTTFSCTVQEWVRSEGKFVIDKQATLSKIRRYTRILKGMGCRIEKDFSEQNMKVYATFESGLKITVMANREAVCKKKVVGKEWVAPSGGYEREIVEWDCEPVSILAAGDE
jgi:hypothetical protein